MTLKVSSSLDDSVIKDVLLAQSLMAFGSCSNLFCRFNFSSAAAEFASSKYFFFNGKNKLENHPHNL